MEGPTTHAVTILVGRKFCEIDPGDVFANGGDTVIFTNATKAPVILFFGNPALFERGQVEIKPEDPPVALTVGRGLAKRSFQYAVYSEKTGTFGVGGSSPRIIVMQ